WTPQVSSRRESGSAWLFWRPSTSGGSCGTPPASRRPRESSRSMRAPSTGSANGLASEPPREGGGQSGDHTSRGAPRRADSPGDPGFPSAGSQAGLVPARPPGHSPRFLESASEPDNHVVRKREHLAPRSVVDGLGARRVVEADLGAKDQPVVEVVGDA